MERPFDHANEKVWPTPRLEARFIELQQHEAELYISEERREQMRYEMACIAFEGLIRQREANQRQAEIEQLESDYSVLSLLRRREPAGGTSEAS